MNESLAILDSRFREPIAHLDIGRLEATADNVLITNSDLALCAANSSFVRFLEANGGAAGSTADWLGTSVIDRMTKPVSNYYQDAFERLLSTAGTWDHDYECHSPDLNRRFHLSCYTLPASAGLVMTHHLVHEGPHSDVAVAVAEVHVSPEGFVVQCSHCRKIRNHERHEGWDWVPTLLEPATSNVSHTFCAPCLDHFYPDLDD